MSSRKYIIIAVLFVALGNISNADTWVDGTHYLYEESQGLLKSIGNNDRANLAPAIGGVAVMPAYKIGDLRKFYAINMQNNTQYRLDATCYAVNDRVYVFIEKGVTIGNNKINALIESFNSIYNKVTDLFGSPPDSIDGDPRVYILLMDIVDGAQPNGVRMLGYFSPIDQFRNIQLAPWTRRRSNEADMLYIDYISLNSKQVSAESVVAHEFVHLIQWGKDPKESTWVNEGIAVYTESVLGYSVKDRISAFEKNPNVSLLDWDDTVESYGSSYLFFAYISEKFGGNDIISAIVNNTSQDYKGIEKALADVGKSTSFSQIFSNWIIANYLDNPSINDGIYGYSTLDIKLNPSILETQYPIDKKMSRVSPWIARYVEFRKNNNDRLSLTLFGNNDEDIHAQMIRIDNDNNTIVSSIESNKTSMIVIERNEKSILVVASQPDPPGAINRNSFYTYSVEAKAEVLAVSPSNSKVATTWGRIKSNTAE